MKIKKKGDSDLMVNNGLSVIIAIIGLLLIGYGIWKLYDVTRDQSAKNAQKTLDRLNEKIEAMGEVGENSFVIQGFSGADKWFLASWTVNDLVRPDKCFFKNCICVCSPDEKELPRASIFYSRYPVYNGTEENAVLAQACQTNGYCRLYDNDIEVVGKYQIMHLVWDNNLKNFIWEYYYSNIYPQLTTNLMILKINKDSQGKVIVSYTIDLTEEQKAERIKSQEKAEERYATHENTR